MAPSWRLNFGHSFSEGEMQDGFPLSCGGHHFFDSRSFTSRWLSAINGTMGSLHDRLIEARTAEPAAYRRPFYLPDDIQNRIAALLTRVGATRGIESASG